MSILQGNSGSNLLIALFGQPVLAGGGNDLVIGGGGHNISLSGGDGNDIIIAGADGQSLRGDNGNDLLIGWTGNDNIVGGNGNDILMGLSGHDLLSGGEGNDYLYGGADSDVFQFNYTQDANLGNDTIGDFHLGEDFLQLYGIPGQTGAAQLYSTVSDFQALITSLNANTHDGYYASAHGNDVVLHLGAGNSITLDGINTGHHLFTGLV